MSHKTPEQIKRRLYAIAGVVALGTAAMVGEGIHGAVTRAHNSDAAKGWPDANTTAPANPDAPYLAKPEAPKPVETHKGMEKSTDPGLKAIAGVEKASGYGFKENMLFTGMPTCPEEAQKQSAEMAERLKKYAEYGISPLVVMEPTAHNGKDNLNLATMTDAKHIDGFRQNMNDYFSGLHNAGITDEQMGAWVPLPEPNIPEWAGGNTDPDTFRRNFTEIAQAAKSHFRGAEVSMMLDSATYQSGSWDSPSYDAESLMRYTSGIPDGLVDSFGYQGLPFNKQDDPSVFLNANTAAQVAQSLNTKKVWLNIGSFGSYTDVATGQRVANTTEAAGDDRANMLMGEVQQAIALKQGGFDASVNIYAAPAPAGSADPDWAYNTPKDKELLNHTLNVASAAAIPASLYTVG